MLFLLALVLALLSACFHMLLVSAAILPLKVIHYSCTSNVLVLVLQRSCGTEGKTEVRARVN